MLHTRRESSVPGSLADSIDDLVFTLDRQQRFTGVYGRWIEQRGIAASSFLGRTVAEVFGSEYAASHDGAQRRVLNGRSADYSWAVVVGDVRTYFHTSVSPLRNAHDEVIGAVGVARDLTAQMKLDDAYEHTAELLEAIVAASPVGIFTLDSEGRIRGSNPSGRRMLGKGEQELMGEMLVRPAESTIVSRRLRDVASAGMSFTGTEVLRWRDDGTGVPLSLSAAPLNGRHGTERAVVALAADITERRRADEMLQRYRLLAEHVRDIIVFVRRDGCIADANEAAVKAYGAPREHLIGSSIASFWPGVAPDREPPAFDSLETTHRRADGTLFPVELSAVGADLDGQRNVVVIARDVTQRRRRQAFERLLHDVDRRILQNDPLDLILSFTCSKIADIFDFALVQISLKGEGGNVTIRKGGGEEIDFLEQIEVRWDESDAGRGPTGTAIRTNQMQYRDLMADPYFEPWRERARERGLRSALALPLVANSRVMGALTLFMRNYEPIDGETMNLLVMFADQIALSLLAAWGQEQIALQRVALESAANAIVVTDLDGVIKWVNPAFERLTGYSKDEAVGSRPSMLKSGNHSAQFYRHMWQTVLDGGVWHGELYNRRKDGTLYIEEQTITPVRRPDGAITHFVAIKQDITARKRHEDQIRHLAMHDALTELPNRRALDAAMERVCFDARRGTPGAVMILDVDNFKPVNDTIGHLGGDQLLAALAKLLRNTLRPADFLARLGGDEFAVVLQDATLDVARGAAERLCAAVAAHPFRFGSRTFELTASIGIAPIDAETTASTAMVNADSAMYAAKDQGKNRIMAYPFGEQEGLRLIEASRWASRIRSALRDGRFVLRYQPVMRLGNNEPEHYEALVRMVDDDGEPILPEDFIAAAERFGLMPQVDRWVVDNVVKVLERSGDDMRIFVNISGASLGDAALLDFIEQRVAQSTMPHGRLAFEITESAAVRDLSTAQAWIHKLKERGCLFAIDDFGVGFSSFSYLRALSADYVKIDRSFVSDIDANPTNRALVQAVKTVAQTLGKEVIAEGVETDAHAAVLIELGVELAQGYRWGIPRDTPA